MYRVLFALGVCVFVGLTARGQALSRSDAQLARIDIAENLGGKLPLALSFRNGKGERVTLREQFNAGKPVLLVLAYYECPMLCTLNLNGIRDSVQQLDWRPGEQFEMLTISIDPNEGAPLAAAKQAAYVESLGKGDIGDGWEFWVADEDHGNVAALADSLGFRYFYDAKRDEYAHTAVAFVMTPDGVISRYLYGLEHEPRDVRLALLEASEGKIGNIVDRLILRCFHYDPQAGKYTLFAGNLMRIGGVLTLIGIGALLVSMRSYEKMKRRREATLGTTSTTAPC